MMKLLSGSGLFVLFCIFLVLKLTGYIAWSWLWVTAPLWIGFVISLLFMVLFIVIFLVANSR